MRAVRPALAVAACLVAVLGSGCTREAAPAPVPVTPTPVETDQEREQRVAYEAAEKSYRAFRAEFRRVTGAGGSAKATSVMKATAGGPYLKDRVKETSAYKDVSYRTRGGEKIGYVRGNGYTTDSLVISACEDDRGVVTLDNQGKALARGGVLQVELEVRRVDSVWKIWSGQGRKVVSCD